MLSLSLFDTNQFLTDEMSDIKPVDKNNHYHVVHF